VSTGGAANRKAVVAFGRIREKVGLPNLNFRYWVGNGRMEASNIVVPPQSKVADDSVDDSMLGRRLLNTVEALLEGVCSQLLIQG
jgi:hypothetical protein